MKKINTVILLSAIIINIFGCSFDWDGLDKRIYDSVFKNANKIVVVKMGQSKYIYSIIKGEELDIFKENMQKIINIKKLSVNPLNSVKGYRLLYAFSSNPRRARICYTPLIIKP